MGFLAALDWLAEKLYGPAWPCGDYEYRHPQHTAKCRRCREFAQWINNSDWIDNCCPHGCNCGECYSRHPDQGPCHCEGA